MDAMRLGFDVLPRLETGSTGRTDGDGGWGDSGSVERAARIFRRQAQPVAGFRSNQYSRKVEGIELCSPSIEKSRDWNRREPNRQAGVDLGGRMEEQKGLTSVPKAARCLSDVSVRCPVCCDRALR